MSITKDFEDRHVEDELWGGWLRVDVEALLAHARALEAMLRGKLDQLSLAGNCIEKGLYDEALLHCRSNHRPAVELLEGVNQ